MNEHEKTTYVVFICALAAVVITIVIGLCTVAMNGKSLTCNPNEEPVLTKIDRGHDGVIYDKTYRCAVMP